MRITVVVYFKILIYCRGREGSFCDDGTGSWKTFLSSELEGPRSQVPKINPKIHLLLLHRGMRLSNWCDSVWLFLYRGESLDPGEDIISRHLCLMAFWRRFMDQFLQNALDQSGLGPTKLWLLRWPVGTGFCQFHKDQHGVWSKRVRLSALDYSF